MKSALLIAASLLSQMALATESGVIRTKDYSCATLQTELATQGSLQVKVFLGSQTVVATSGQCAVMGQEATGAYYRSSDKALCELGFVCSFRPVGGE